jgi:hypothetical protein
MSTANESIDYETLPLTIAESLGKKSSEANETITKRNYKQYTIVPPLAYARPFWVNFYGAPDHKEGVEAAAATDFHANGYVCLFPLFSLMY